MTTRVFKEGHDKPCRMGDHYNLRFFRYLCYEPRKWGE